MYLILSCKHDDVIWMNCVVLFGNASHSRRYFSRIVSGINHWVILWRNQKPQQPEFWMFNLAGKSNWKHNLCVGSFTKWSVKRESCDQEQNNSVNVNTRNQSCRTCFYTVQLFRHRDCLTVPKWNDMTQHEATKWNRAKSRVTWADSCVDVYWEVSTECLNVYFAILCESSEQANMTRDRASKWRKVMIIANIIRRPIISNDRYILQAQNAMNMK